MQKKPIGAKAQAIAMADAGMVALLTFKRAVMALDVPDKDMSTHIHMHALALQSAMSKINK